MRWEVGAGIILAFAGATIAGYLIGTHYPPQRYFCEGWDKDSGGGGGSRKEQPPDAKKEVIPPA